MTKAKKWALAEIAAIFTLVMLDIWVFDTQIVPWVACILAIIGIAIADFVIRVRGIKKGIPEDIDPAVRNALVADRIGDYTQELGFGRWRKSAEEGWYQDFFDWRKAWRLTKLVLLALVLVLIAGYFFKPNFWAKKDFWSKKIYVGTVLYCLWGLIQQTVMHAYVTSRLYMIFAKDPNPMLAEKRAVKLTALCVGILFFLVHMPNPTLMIVTPIAGAVTAYIFLNCRNVLMLAIAHGILGNTIGVCLANTLRIGWHYWS